MLNLLSKKLQRQLNLLEILFEEERCRLSQLEKRLASSGKTLRNDFIEINTYSSDIQIVTDRDAGVTAIFSPAFTKDHIYQIVISQSTEYKYLETILLHPKENYLELAEYLFISESTLRRIVKKTQSKLKKYDLRIKGLTRIVGEGQVIDGLTARLLMEKYPSPASIFNRSFSESIYDVVILFLKENQLYEVAKNDPKTLCFLHFFIACRIQRFNKNKMEMEQKKISCFTFSFLEKNHLSHFSLPREEKIWQWIFDTEVIHTALKIRNASEQGKYHFCISNCLMTWMDCLEKKYQLECENKDLIVQRCKEILTQPRFPEYILNDPSQTTIVDPPILACLYEELKGRMVDDCREKGYVIPELDSFVRHAILEILFDWPLLLSYIEGKENKLKAVIVINTRKKQADYIAKRLQKKLGDYYQFSVMPNFYQKEKKSYHLDIDCIITNVMIDDETNIPVFGISLFPNQREIQNLLHFYQKKYQVVEEKSLYV